MLSSTADHLFWMARYIERAENTARMLDVQVQTQLLPGVSGDPLQGWRAMLGISELDEAYRKRYGQVTPENVLEFMVSDPSNPSAILNCLSSARENARAVRGTVTTEVWETQNQTWLEMQKWRDEGGWRKDPSRLFEWVKFRSHLTRGVTIGTMLRDEASYFIRLGTFLERADNTARILDVKYHGASQSALGNDWAHSADALGGLPGGGNDYYYWAAILRSVSGFEIYRKVYRDVITPERVAELLIFDRDMPRSLTHCLKEVCMNLERVRNDVSDETERRAGMLQAQLHYGRVEEVAHAGLHAYLTDFLERVYDLGQRIHRNFLMTAPPENLPVV